MMRFSDVCLLTENVPALARFYETVLQVKADGDDVHVSFELDGAGLAIYAKAAAKSDMGFSFPKWGAGNFTLGINVENVDAEYERLKTADVEFITTPTTYPWGARSVHFRDPDGNIVCFRTVAR